MKEIILLTGLLVANEQSLLWKKQANAPYEAKDISTFKNNKHEYLKIRAIDNIEQDAAEKKIELRKEEIKTLFQKSVDPYYGTATDYNECLQHAELEKPGLKSKESISIHFFLHANTLLSTVSCKNNEKKYQQTFSYLYCMKAKKLFEIRHFYTAKTSRKKILDWRCANDS